MSTTDPTGEGGGGGGEGAMSTNAEQNASPSTPNTGATVPVQATTQQQQQHPPPSPLSGCYLLVVLPEPHTAQHKDLILNRLAKGELSLLQIADCKSRNDDHKQPFIAIYTINGRYNRRDPLCTRDVNFSGDPSTRDHFNSTH